MDPSTARQALEALRARVLRLIAVGDALRRSLPSPSDDATLEERVHVPDLPSPLAGEQVFEDALDAVLFAERRAIETLGRHRQAMEVGANDAQQLIQDATTQGLVVVMTDAGASIRAAEGTNLRSAEAVLLRLLARFSLGPAVVEGPARDRRALLRALREDAPERMFAGASDARLRVLLPAYGPAP